MDQKELISRLREYNKTRNSSECTGLEKQYMKYIDEHNYLYTNSYEAELPDDVELFLDQHHHFKGLVGEHHEKLCRYLRHIQEYTCNTGLIRMDIRSKRFSRYKEKVFRAIACFYWFYGSGMSMKDLVYGEYRDLFYGADFSQVIVSELLAENPEAIQYCRDVLTSENNTAVLTRGVIIAVEQSRNQELQQILLQVFLAAKLQEGLRQSIVETADENTMNFFQEVLGAIERENLLRFSSVQRAVLTWIGIGYQEVKEKDVRYIFEHIRLYLPEVGPSGLQGLGKPKQEKMSREAFEKSENPLDIYIALYCRGAFDVEEAIQEALILLQSDRRYVVASALVYLRLTKSFDVESCLDFPEKFGDDEWILALFYSECIRLGKEIEKLHLTKEQTQKLYGQMASFLPSVGNKKVYTSKGFEWFDVTLTRDSLCYCMIRLLEKYPSSEMVEQFLPYVASALGTKDLDFFMGKLFRLAPEAKRKRFMLKEIISSNDALGKWIVQEYRESTLTEEDILQLEGRLKSKKAKARAFIVEVLASQKQESVRASYARLKESAVKTIRESALELRKKAGKYFEGEVSDGDSEKESVEKEAGIGRTGFVSTKFPPLEIKGKEKGFGLYEPKHVYELEFPEYLQVSGKGLLKKEKYVDLQFIFPWDKEKVLDYIRRWGERIISHEDEEYYTGYEYRQVKDRGFYAVNHGEKGLAALPLSDTWKNYFEEDNLTPETVFEIRFLFESTYDSVYLEKMTDVKSELFTLERAELKEIPYVGHFETILMRYYADVLLETDFAETAAKILQMLARYGKYLIYKKKRYDGTEETHALTSNRSIIFLQGQLHLQQSDDEHFRKYFPVVLELYNKFNLGNPSTVLNLPVIQPMVLARAVCLEMLPVEALYEGILDHHMEEQRSYYYRYRGQLNEAFRDAYFEGRGTWGKPRLNLESYRHVQYGYGKEVLECLRSALDTISNTLLAMECQRLNEKTEVTDYVEGLVVIRGVEYLILALQVLEGEDIRRQTYGEDRNIVFSNVIRHCYPSSFMENIEKGGDAAMISDTEESNALNTSDAKALAAARIPEERLVEAAMLAPQWIDVVNEVLKWDGFKGACYYFTAHMKQYDLKQKKAEIAKYTELEPEDLYDGAFDMDWCRNVYESLGEKRFQILYKASKFLCENSFHTRARKYADACLGKKGKEVWKKEAVEKRNKDALNAYCICPLESDADLLERYLYVQQFLKESKKFGSQRQASEKRAAEMALMNLARNSRFETVTRLSWMMESEGIRQNEDVLSPQILSGGEAGAQNTKTGDKGKGTKDCIEAWIEIDGQGRNEICIRKNGKKQKSVPAALKKDERMLHLKEIHSQWNEQYKRSRRMLEQAMEERTVFSREELGVMMHNPIVAPMLEKLVLISGDEIGFYRDGKFGNIPASGQADTVRIAHPYDLYEHQAWHTCQKQIFDEGTVQPFKQVFRELYLKLEDEQDMSESRRYSGYQIQTKKAAAALKSRKWNVSYENGLERVYYKDNLIVNLYAEADWFSPSDIEAPAIEYVSFSSRKDGKKVLIRDIDPVTFSETMRDVDLAVSTAYVGGVDPVTSFSTMELRKTIVEYTCQLMKLTNVTVQEHFADIKGGLNNYSVHLGSGVVHQSGGGAIHIVAVHSGKRGKVYLPFLDEDPKTAEILSKVILLAEDKKIKDPEILRQIVRREDK